MKVFGQLEKAQLENLTADPSGAGLVPGLIWYRTDTKVFKVYDGTVVQTFVDLTSAQTLSNKTLTAPVITGGTATNTSLVTPTINVETHVEQTVMPSAPTTGQRKFYPKADGFYQLTSGGLESKIGTGSGGGSVNFITNGNADDAVASILIPYIGSGVTPAGPGAGTPGDITTAITTTNPLSGTKSYLFTKSGSVNSQGRGGKIPFTVDPAYRAKSIKISFDYIVNSGVFTPGSPGVNSDVIVYIWDLTNNVAIEPSSIKLLANSTSISDKYEASFQTSVNGSSYLLMLQVSTTTANNFELQIDNISVGPQNYVYGSPVTNNRNYTAILTNLGNASQNLFYKDDGDEIVISGYIGIGSIAPSGGALIISLPNGMNYDPAKVGLNGAINPVGSGTAYRNSTGATYQGVVMTVVGSTNTLQINGENGGSAWTSGNPIVFSNANADRIYLNDVRIPILGKSSSVQMSDGYDGRVISAALQRATSSQSIPAATDTKVQFNGKLSDSVNAFDSVTNFRYTVVSAGTYKFNGALVVSALASTQTLYAILYKNGAGFRTAAEYMSTGANGGVTYNFQDDAKVGDYYEIFISCGAATTLLSNGTVFGGSTLNIEKLSGSATISASEEMSLRYTSSSGQTITTSTATYVYGVRDYDSHGYYNPTTGEFRPGTAGRFKIKAQLLNNYNAVVYDFYVRFYKNGLIISYNVKTVPAGTGNLVSHEDTLNLISGDIVTIRVDQSTGTGSAAISSATNFLTIERIK